MTIKDTANGYSWLTIALHWISAITVIILLGLVIAADGAPEKQESALMGWHISIAVSMYLILWARVLWRLFNRRPTLAPQNPILHQLAFWVPLVLIVAIALQLISGPLLVLSHGYPIQAFGTTIVPAIMEEREGLHEAAETVHAISGQAIFWVAILHVLGAFKHLIFNRDGTFRKILVPGNRPE